MLILLFICNEVYPLLWFIPFVPCFTYVTIQLLLTNLEVIHSILFTFQFIYKFFTAIGLFLFECTLAPPPDAGLITTIHFMNGLFLTVNIIAWSLSDGWQINHKIRIFFGLWLIVHIFFIYFKLYFIASDDDILISPFNGNKNNDDRYNISIRNSGLSCAFNLVIFLGVQVFEYIKRPQEYHLVPQRVKLKWKEDRKNSLVAQTSISKNYNNNNKDKDNTDTNINTNTNTTTEAENKILKQAIDLNSHANSTNDNSNGKNDVGDVNKTDNRNDNSGLNMPAGMNRGESKVALIKTDTSISPAVQTESK